MAKLPRLDEFNDAVQNPHIAFFDAVLKKGQVTQNGFAVIPLNPGQLRC